jgi:hypothetical protein
VKDLLAQAARLEPARRRAFIESAAGGRAEIVAEANRIYVFDRLYHHLLPQRFPPLFVVRHLLLIAALAGLVYFAPRNREFLRLRAFVAASVGISAVGMLIGILAPIHADLAAALLRYYWFRTSGVMVPLGAALVLGSILYRWQTTRPAWHAAGLVAALAIVGCQLGETMWRRQLDPRPPADEGIANVAAWREACEWAAAETAPDAVFLTPRLSQTFRWYAGRAEVVNRKDIPQDARGIVEYAPQRVDSRHAGRQSTPARIAGRARFQATARAGRRVWSRLRHHDSLPCAQSSPRGADQSQRGHLSTD